MIADELAVFCEGIIRSRCHDNGNPAADPSKPFENSQKYDNEPWLPVSLTDTRVFDSFQCSLPYILEEVRMLIYFMFYITLLWYG